MQTSSVMRIASPVFFLVFLLSLRMQGQSTGGSMRGVVRDATGARVECVSAKATLQASSITRGAVCNSRGEFRLDGLAPGEYRLRIQASGFATASAEVSVRIGVLHEITVRIELHPLI